MTNLSEISIAHFMFLFARLQVALTAATTGKPQQQRHAEDETHLFAVAKRVEIGKRQG